MKLVLKELYFEDMSKVRRKLEVMGSLQFMYVFGFIELEVGARVFNLVNSGGKGVPVQSFSSNLKRIRDWLAAPGDVAEYQFTTHPIGGYFLRFGLSGENVELTAHENAPHGGEEHSETLSIPAAKEALRAFRSELRSQMLKDAPREAAEFFWKVTFAYKIDEDPYA